MRDEIIESNVWKTRQAEVFLNNSINWISQIENKYAFWPEKKLLFSKWITGKFKLNFEYPIFANQPTNPSQIISDIQKHTHRPNHRISYVDGPLGYKEVTYLFRKPKAILN